MSIFARVSEPTKPKTENVKSVALLYAGILTVLALMQLFNFTNFITLVESFWLPGGLPFAYFLSAFIVVAEVFALPFLLRMRISGLFRFVSMIFGWIVPAAWFKLSLWLLFTTNAVSNVGLLGTTFDLTPGWWSVLFSLAMGILAIWASWGMWPKLRKK